MPKKRSYQWCAAKRGIDPNTPRLCRVCNAVLPVSAFPTNGNGYYETLCNACKLSRMREEYRQEKALRSDKYWQVRLKSLKQNAVSRGLSCDITIADIKTVFANQRGCCYYTGMPLVVDSVDRIDHERGYQRDNILICERHINVFRAKRSRADFIALCSQIAQQKH